MSKTLDDAYKVLNWIANNTRPVMSPRSSVSGSRYSGRRHRRAVGSSKRDQAKVINTLTMEDSQIITHQQGIKNRLPMITDRTRR